MFYDIKCNHQIIILSSVIFPPSPKHVSPIHLFLQKISLAEQLYIADNLAFFPYQTQDEPLFIINQIDIIVSVSGSNILQSFKEVLSTLQCSILLSLLYDKDKCCIHRCNLFVFFVTSTIKFYCIFFCFILAFTLA